MDEIQKTKKSKEHAPDWFTNLFWEDPKRPVNPYGEHPVADYLVAADAGLSKFKPFSGVDDVMNVAINNMTGIGPQTKRELEDERYEKMLRSEAGTISGGLLGTAANALIPTKAIPYSMGLGAVEGVFSDPDRALSPEGAAWGTGLAALPLLKFLKMDPRGIPPESFVRTKIPNSNETVAGNFPVLPDIVEMIKEQVPRKLTTMESLKKMLGMPVPTHEVVRTQTIGKKIPMPSGLGRELFHETGARMMGEAHRRSLTAEGKKAMLDPYTSDRFREHFKSKLKETHGLNYGPFTSSNRPETVMHEGIHAAFQQAAEKANIPSDHLYRLVGSRLDQHYPNVTEALHDFITAKGYDVDDIPAELVSHLNDVLTRPDVRQKMINSVFGGDKILYRAWSDEAKKAYKAVVKLAKDISPEKAKTMIEAMKKKK